MWDMATAARARARSKGAGAAIPAQRPLPASVLDHISFKFLSVTAVKTVYSVVIPIAYTRIAVLTKLMTVPSGGYRCRLPRCRPPPGQSLGSHSPRVDLQ